MINHPNRSKAKFDGSAIISGVAFHEGRATFKAQGRKWTYYATRGRLETNTAGDPLHYCSDGSFCLSNGQSFGEVMSNAHLLGAIVSPQRS